MKKAVRLFFVFIVFCTACTQKTEKKTVLDQATIKPLPPDSMELIMRDVYLTESYIRWSSAKGYEASALTKHYYDLLFDKYHIDSTRFAFSLKYYASQEDLWFDMLSRVLNERLFERDQ